MRHLVFSWDWEKFLGLLATIFVILATLNYLVGNVDRAIYWVLLAILFTMFETQARERGL